jgi:nucleotide-binding universal stress UspA family protein
MNAIVVGTDGSSGAEAAVRKVIELAKDSGASIQLVCAYPGRSTLERLGLTAKTAPVDMRGVAADVLARDERRFEEAGFNVDVHAREGDPAETLIKIAGETNADLIAIGSHGTSGLARFALGSVASKLSHHATTSLLIVRED